jgi:multiple sugar transport system substrate-binding protein
MESGKYDMKRVIPSIVVAAILFSASGIGIAVRAQSSKAAPITIWTKFNDQNPQNSQDKWLAAALKEYMDKTGNKVTNVNQPYDQINSKLNIAVQSHGDVPDLSYVDSSKLGFYTQNGILMDITDYVKAAPWFKNLRPVALASCTTPDGKILCVPTGLQNTLVYYMKDLYPNGFPATTDALLEAAKDLKAKGKFAVTFKGSEVFAAETTYFGLIKSYGGEIAGKDGKATWASPQTVEALKFVRELFINKYAPEVALAPGFDDEQPFMRGDAAGFLAGSWSYVYLNPLTAPDGTKFDKESASVEEAFKAGKLGFAPPLAAPKGKPVVFSNMTGWAIPVGAVHIDAAKAFINFQMTTERNAAYAVAYGALRSMTSAMTAKEFQTPYWQAVEKYQQEYALPAPGLIEYDKGMQLLADTIVKLMTNPSKDIAKELQAAQDEYNASLK